MRAETATVVIEQVDNPALGQPVTRLRYGGWLVHIDGQGAVRVPRQDTSGKTIEDLDFCLRSGYALLRGAELPSAPPAAPAPLRVPAALAEALCDVLRAAREIARQQRHHRSHDVYACLSQAWQDTQMQVPHRLLLRAVRAALPHRTTPMDFCHTSSPQAVVGLYSAAIKLLEGTSPAAGGVDSPRGVA